MRALIVSADGFEDTELLVPWYRLREAGIEVDIASSRPGTFSGKHGYEVTAGIGVGDVDAERYDLLLLPGGKAPAKLREDQRLLDIARKFFADDRPVAAICHGPQILVSAGLLKGRAATCYKTVATELQEAGADYQDRELVVDGNLITSRQPDDLPAFTREIMRRIG